MPILVPVDFVYKHVSPFSTYMIKRTLRFWFGSNCVPGISFAYLYAYSKKSFGYFNYLIGYLRKYAAYLELWLHKNRHFNIYLIRIDSSIKILVQSTSWLVITVPNKCSNGILYTVPESIVNNILRREAT